MSTPKEKFALRVLALNARCSVLMDALPELNEAYFSNEWDLFGSDAITDNDLLDLHITAAQIDNFIVTIQELNNFFGNLPVIASDHGASINRLRYGGA